jgi:hypothetical protein
MSRTDHLIGILQCLSSAVNRPGVRSGRRALAPILIEAMERHGRLQLAPEVRASLLAMSAATIDRAPNEGIEGGSCPLHPGLQHPPRGERLRRKGDHAELSSVSIYIGDFRTLPNPSSCTAWEPSPQKGGCAGDRGAGQGEGFPLPPFQIAAYKIPISGSLTSN